MKNLMGRRFRTVYSNCEEVLKLKKRQFLDESRLKLLDPVFGH